jgi:hypothetical protein
LAKFTVKSTVLLEPITLGALEITLILYPVPAAVPDGIDPEIVPEFAILDKVPMFTGVPKVPVALDNCAVYILPAV